MCDFKQTIREDRWHNMQKKRISLFSNWICSDSFDVCLANVDPCQKRNNTYSMFFKKKSFVCYFDNVNLINFELTTLISKLSVYRFFGRKTPPFLLDRFFVFFGTRGTLPTRDLISVVRAQAHVPFQQG